MPPEDHPKGVAGGHVPLNVDPRSSLPGSAIRTRHRLAGAPRPWTTIRPGAMHRHKAGAGVSGTCMAMGATNGGVLVMRLYVPVDIDGDGTGGVPLPTISKWFVVVLPLCVAKYSDSPSPKKP